MKQLVLLLACLSPLPAWARTTNGPVANNPSAIDAAIRSAAAGDTVLIAGTTATWNGRLDITNSIDLEGAGVGQTVINNGEISINIKGSAFVTVGNLSMNGVRNDFQLEALHTNPRVGVHIHHMNFVAAANQGTRLVHFYDMWGLMDHCYLRNTTGSGQGMAFDSLGNWCSITNWNYPVVYGSTNRMVVEDCIFDWVQDADGCFDAYDGAVFTFRHNSITNTIAGWHGEDSSGRSVRQFEIYNNTFTAVGYTPDVTWIRSRGGCGVIYSNAASGANNGMMTLLQYRADGGGNGAAPGQSYDANWNLSYPGNGYPTGYPIRGNTGWGSFTNAPGNSYPWSQNDPSCSGGCTYASWGASLEPVYQWGNKYNGATATLDSDAPSYVMENREYYNNVVKPGYVALAYPHPMLGGVQPPATNPPSITQEPVGVTNSTANGFTLSVTAMGDGTLLYQWSKDQTNYLTGSTNATLTAVPATTSQSGGYSVFITNQWGWTTSLVAQVLITNLADNSPAAKMAVSGATLKGVKIN